MKKWKNVACFTLLIIIVCFFPLSANAETNITCPNCGKQVPASSNFCMICGFRLSNESSDISSQLQLICEKSYIWNIEGEYAPNGCYYAVTDLDQDGRLEVISASNYSSGNYTHLEIREVNADNTWLIDCGTGIKENFSLCYERVDNEQLRDDICYPDLLPYYWINFGEGDASTTLNAYKEPAKDIWYYTYSNFNSAGPEEREEIKESFFLATDGFHVEPLVWKYSYTTPVINQVKYYDNEKNEISELQYMKWELLFQNCIRKQAKISWFTVENNIANLKDLQDSYSVFAASMR